MMVMFSYLLTTINFFTPNHHHTIGLQLCTASFPILSATYQTHATTICTTQINLSFPARTKYIAYYVITMSWTPSTDALESNEKPMNKSNKLIVIIIP